MRIKNALSAFSFTSMHDFTAGLSIARRVDLIKDEADLEPVRISHKNSVTRYKRVCLSRCVGSMVNCAKTVSEKLIRKPQAKRPRNCVASPPSELCGAAWPPGAKCWTIMGRTVVSAACTTSGDTPACSAVFSIRPVPESPCCTWSGVAVAF